MFTKRIIIGGLPRSGSTLLRSILNAHPKIIAPPETSILIRPFEEQVPRKRRLCKKIGDKFGISYNLEHVFNCAGALECVDNIMLEYLKFTGRSENINVWAEKTPRNCLQYQQLYREDPSLFFISTIRDGRDVITSIFPGQDNYYCSIERYIETMNAIYSFENERNYLVRYEELIDNPEQFMRNILDFLEIPFSKVILTKYPNVTGRCKQPKVKGRISSKWVGRWQQELHSHRINDFYSNPEAVKWLKISGYDV